MVINSVNYFEVERKALANICSTLEAQCPWCEVWDFGLILEVGVGRELCWVTWRGDADGGGEYRVAIADSCIPAREPHTVLSMCSDVGYTIRCITDFCAPLSYKITEQVDES